MDHYFDDLSDDFSSIDDLIEANSFDGDLLGIEGIHDTNSSYLNYDESSVAGFNIFDDLPIEDGTHHISFAASFEETNHIHEILTDRYSSRVHFGRSWDTLGTSPDGAVPDQQYVSVLIPQELLLEVTEFFLEREVSAYYSVTEQGIPKNLSLDEMKQKLGL